MKNFQARHVARLYERGELSTCARWFPVQVLIMSGTTRKLADGFTGDFQDEAADIVLLRWQRQHIVMKVKWWW